MKTSFYDRYHKKNKKFFSIIGENNFTYYYQLKMLRTILPQLKGKDILDVGCGVGTIAFYLANKGYDVTGVDVSHRAIQLSESYAHFSKLKNIHFLCADIEHTTIDQKFDLIICTELIEHLEQDLPFIQKLYAVTKTGGFLLLSTPSVAAPLYKLGFLQTFDREVGHLRRYTPQGVRTIIEQAGFEVVSVQRREGILRNSLFTFGILGKLIRYIRWLFVPLFHFVDEVTVLLWGESDLLVIAKKR